jgi:hypothetical protein
MALFSRSPESYYVPESERGEALAEPVGHEGVKWLPGCVSPRILGRKACLSPRKR